MRPTLLISTLSFLLLFAFITNLSLAFPNKVEPVLDITGEPIRPGSKYYVISSGRNRNGGLRPGKTGDQTCQVTVMQDHSPMVLGVPVIFTLKGTSSTGDIISTNDPLEIEFTKKADCAESSKWMVFYDEDIEYSVVGIGGLKNHPGPDVMIDSGEFKIRKYKKGYKLVFCEFEGDPYSCSEFGKYPSGKGGSRLILGGGQPLYVGFRPLNNNFKDGIMSVV
ncbi:Proteinase inhibitor I3, Kunitz legume [Sesbania bispinosa]|nr:Proteinase inhibitor I3, Kunitz legume [Sesbania bispinosa]